MLIETVLIEGFLYFEALLNGENESELDVVEAVEAPLHEITEQEVERALKGMKNGRASGPSVLMSDLLKYAGWRLRRCGRTPEGFSENYEKWNSANGVGSA